MASVKVGQYTFSINPSDFRIESSKDISVEKFAGAGFVVEDLDEGPEVWVFSGALTGANAATDAGSLRSEWRRNRIIEIDPPSGIRENSYGVLMNPLTFSERGGYTQYYPYRFTALIIGERDEWKREIAYDWKWLENDWNITGDIVVPTSVGGSNVSETVDFNRVGADGTIPCVLAPERTEIWFDCDESNMGLGKINVAYDSTHTKELVVHNQTIKLRTRHDEATYKGHVDIDGYNGSAWVNWGRLQLRVKSSGGSEETLDDLVPSYGEGPEIPMGPPYRASDHVFGRLVYPSSTTNSYCVALYYELWRGKPWIWLQAYNYGVQLSQVEYLFIFNTSNFAPRYWNRNGTERDAQAGTYGVEAQAGDTDLDNVAYFNTASPIAASTDIMGFARTVKTNCDHIGNDAGNNWDYGGCKFDTLTWTPSNMTNGVWLFAYRYAQGGGSRTPAQIGAEAVKQIRSFSETLRRTSW